MTDETTLCQSCGMPIEAGPYCRYCVTESGDLQTFEERFERLCQFIRRTNDELSPAEAEARALNHMSTMPAWRNHPALRALLTK